jgi:hypothetical protein
VLSSLGALKGLGQIRVAEINMAREAAASPDNSIPANKLLVEISKRTHQRNADIAEMAQNYKEQNGTLDAGFDKQVTAYYKGKTRCLPMPRSRTGTRSSASRSRRRRRARSSASPLRPTSMQRLPRASSSPVTPSWMPPAKPGTCPNAVCSFQRRACDG